MGRHHPLAIIFSTGFAAAALIGCPGATPDALCCTEFKVGADLTKTDFGVDASVKGQFGALAQASADLAAAAQGALDDVSQACLAIATDGGATGQELTTGASLSPRDAVAYYCKLAVAKLDATLKAKGTLTIAVDAPKCEASVSATAKCEASCSASGGCDASATPPTCEGGKMEVSCQGSCSAQGGASIACEGSCGGSCEGSCSAEGGAAIECDGKCEGTCAPGGSAGGSGIQADGSCKGTCNGTCTLRAGAKVTCQGSCKGQCGGTCSAKAGASVKCDGSCTGKAEPISCKGGTLKASCNVDAKCDANCNASAQAKADCTPPRVDVRFTGSADAAANAMLESLRVNLPRIFLVVEARGKAFGDLIGSVAVSARTAVDPGKLGVKGTACLVPIAETLVEAGANATASFSAAFEVSSATKG